jgi:4-amino-4-deoxy-L-arabinose transferase-like glycosyltransferase
VKSVAHVFHFLMTLSNDIEPPGDTDVKALKSWLQCKQTLAGPLLLVVVLNVASFFLSIQVGSAVGGETGSDGYKEIAENVVAGKGFIFSEGAPSTLMFGYMKREPVYPLFRSAILLITGTLSPVVLCIFQTFLSLISCCLVNRLGDRIFGPSTAKLAAYIYALHPIGFWYSTRFANEVLTVPIVLCCLVLIENFFVEPTRIKAAQMGLAIGIATLTRSNCVTLLPVILGFGLVKWRTKLLHQFVGYMFIAMCFYASIHSLWLMRNYSISGEIVPFTTMAGGQFFVGNGIVEHFDLKKQTAGDRIEEPPEKAASALYYSVQSEIVASVPQISWPSLEAKTDKQLMTMARSFFIERPLFMARKFLSGMFWIWFLSDTTAKSRGWIIFQTPLLVFAAIGLCRLRNLEFNMKLLICVVVLYLVPYTLLNTFARYSMPIIPVVMLFASYGLIGFIRPDAARRYLA